MTSSSDTRNAGYLLDSNILSDLVRHPTGTVARRIAELGENAVCTSIIVACELRFGAAKKSSPVLSSKIEQMLASLEVLPLGVDADRYYAELRFHLEKNGTPIGPNDMLIAAHALSLGFTLVTDNMDEFARVPGLTVENWLAL
jgi:tRNA(fMet)-specific endonuclease VapC